MGCGGSYVQRQPDVLVQGTGVEPIHCYIENINGVVSLYPLGEMSSVDGLPVAAPTRLTQGILFRMASIFLVSVLFNATCQRTPVHGCGQKRPIGTYRADSTDAPLRQYEDDGLVCFAHFYAIFDKLQWQAKLAILVPSLGDWNSSTLLRF